MENMPPESSTIAFVKEQFGKLQDAVMNSQDLLIQIALYGIGSVIVGFFMKRYFHFVLVSIVALVVVYLVLENLDAITIDWLRLQEFAGINPQQSIGEVAGDIGVILRQHWLLVLISVFGFVIGYSIG